MKKPILIFCLMLVIVTSGFEKQQDKRQWRTLPKYYQTLVADSPILYIYPTRINCNNPIHKTK